MKSVLQSKKIHRDHNRDGKPFIEQSNLDFDFSADTDGNYYQTLNEKFCSAENLFY